MAYKRKKNYKKRSGRKRSFYRRYKPRAQIGYNDQLLTASISTAASAVFINNILAGGNYNQRIGQTMYMKRLWFRSVMTLGDAFNAFRFMIIYDKQPTGLLPTAADIFQSPASPITSLYAINNLQRFVIIRDRKIMIDTENPQMLYDFSMKIPKYASFSRYDTTGAGAITNCKNGALYVVIFSDSDIVPNPQAYIQVRIQFVS